VNEKNLKLLRELVISHFPDGGEFKPCVMYNKELDILTILEKDCAYCEESDPKSNLAILRDLYDDDKIVGVQISQWSHWLKDE